MVEEAEGFVDGFDLEVFVLDLELEELDDAFFARARADVVADLVPVVGVFFEGFQQQEELLVGPGGVAVGDAGVVWVFLLHVVDDVVVFGHAVVLHAAWAEVVFDIFRWGAGSIRGTVLLVVIAEAGAVDAAGEAEDALS